MTVYYACPECEKPFDIEEVCHYPENLVGIHERPDGNHWFELTNGIINRNYLLKKTVNETTVADKSTTRRWEYRVVEVVIGMDSFLNDQGKQGWELVTMLPKGSVDPYSANVYAYLKREVCEG